MNQSQKDAIRAARLKREREVRERRAAGIVPPYVPVDHDSLPAFMGDRYISLGDGNYLTTGGHKSW